MASAVLNVEAEPEQDPLMWDEYVMGKDKVLFVVKHNLDTDELTITVGTYNIRNSTEISAAKATFREASRCVDGLQRILVGKDPDGWWMQHVDCCRSWDNAAAVYCARDRPQSSLWILLKWCEAVSATLFVHQAMLRRRLAAYIPLAKPSTRRWYAIEPTPPSPSPPPQLSRIARLESRLPRFLHRYTTPLRTAPVSHITAFFILHEITAILPLFGLAALFHYTNWLPPGLSEWKWVSEGIVKFGKYARRKGWISEAEEGDAKVKGGIGKWWGTGEAGTRWVVEFATAYACTKVLLPLRLVISVWGTPLFARWTVVPVGGAVRRVVGRWFPSRSGGVLKTKS